MLAVIMALVGDGRRDAGEDDGGNPEVDSMFGEISLPFAFIPLELHRVNVTTNSSYEKFEIDMLDELRKIRYARFRLEMIERLSAIHFYRNVTLHNNLSPVDVYLDPVHKTIRY